MALLGVDTHALYSQQTHLDSRLTPFPLHLNSVCPKIYLPEKLREINLDNFWSSSTAVAIVGQRVFALFIYFCSSCSAFLCSSCSVFLCSSCSAFLCACYAWPTAPNCFPLQRYSQTFSFVSIWHPPLWQPTCFYLAHPSWDVLGAFWNTFFSGSIFVELISPNLI